MAEVKLKYFNDQTPLSNKMFLYYKKSKLKYTDSTFKPNDYSLFSIGKNGKYYTEKYGSKITRNFIKTFAEKEIIWERISDMPECNKIYSSEYSYENIMQGSIGDCYLISALCSLSQYPDLIVNKENNFTNIIHNSQYSEIGYFEIKLFINGEYQIVIIDDYIPYYKNKKDIAFAKSSKNFYWVLLIEKAIAKIFGGYSNIVNYSNDEEDEENKDENEKEYENLLTKTNKIFQILTGFVPEYFYFDNEYNLEYHKTKIYDKNKAYNEIYYKGLFQKNDIKNPILITSGSLSKDEGVLEENYIPYKHSFSILEVKSIFLKQQKDEIKLLLLNNPWGKNIYNGNNIGEYIYNPRNKDMEELNKYIQYNMNSKDGTFWIDIDTFYENFSYVSICKIISDSDVSIYYFDDDIYYLNPMIFNMIVTEDNTLCSISVHGKQNLNKLLNDKIYKYLIINKYDQNNNIIETYSKYDYYDDIGINLELNKGNYIIWVYIPKKFNKDISYMRGSLKIVNNKKILFDFIKFDVNYKYIIQSAKDILLLKENNIMSEFDKYKKNIFSKISYKSIDGFGIIYLRNKTQKNYELDLSIEFEYIEILNPGFSRDFNIYNIKDYLINEIIYIFIIKNSDKRSIQFEYTYDEEEGNINSDIKKDNSFYNFNNLQNEENIKKNKNIIISYFKTSKYNKINSKIYEKMKYYDKDNLIHDLDSLNGIDNKKREVRSINKDNNIFSFSEFKKSYQNETYSDENVHGFKNKKNKKISFKKHNSNSNFNYMSNENNSGIKFKAINSDSIKDSVNIQLTEEKMKTSDENIYDELNLPKYFYNFIDYMYFIEKKKNQNIPYMEVKSKYKGIWDQMKEEEKMVYAFMTQLEENKEFKINDIFND